MTNECRPPEGTKAGTYHVLRRGGEREVVIYRNHRWVRHGSNTTWSIDHMDSLDWRYSHAIDLSAPAAPISDEELATRLRATWMNIPQDMHADWLAVARKARELLQGGTAPAAPDPLQPLRDAVVEKAREARAKGNDGGVYQTYLVALRELFAAVDALTAALTPPDPVAELRAAAERWVEQWEGFSDAELRRRHDLDECPDYEMIVATRAALEAVRGKS